MHSLYSTSFRYGLAYAVTNRHLFVYYDVITAERLFILDRLQNMRYMISTGPPRRQFCIYAFRIYRK